MEDTGWIFEGVAPLEVREGETHGPAEKTIVTETGTRIFVGMGLQYETTGAENETASGTIVTGTMAFTGVDLPLPSGGADPPRDAISAIAIF